MKVKNSFNLYAIVSFSLAVLVPVPGRFAYGLIFAIAVNLFMFIGTLFKKLVSELEMDELHPIMLAVVLISTAVIFKQLLILFSPSIAMTLGFSLYMASISSFMIGTLYDKKTLKLSEELSFNMRRSGYYSLYAVVYFLFRDIFGYGTISLPVPDGLYYVHVFPLQSSYFSASSFFASIPGAILLTVLLLVLFTYINKKMSIIGSITPDSTSTDSGNAHTDKAEEKASETSDNAAASQSSDSANTTSASDQASQTSGQSQTSENGGEQSSEPPVNNENSAVNPQSESAGTSENASEQGENENA